VRLPPALRRPLARLRRTTCEALGNARYSRPAQHQLDRRLERHLDIDRGFFVEAGANDGYLLSNTYYFEKIRGWNGLLVEPVPELATECRRNRRARVFQAALVAAARPGETVELHFAGLMSTVAGALGDAAVTADHVAKGLAVQGLNGSYQLQVPARTLTDILDEARVTREIDLLSLDVEGGELAALRGLDLGRYAPRFICVEARARSEIDALLAARYRVAEVLAEASAYQDVLYQRR
jgi:FkbM family methyltransferase